MLDFKISKTINNLKFEIEKKLNEDFYLYKIDLPTISEFEPQRKRCINFDNSKNNLIYQIKTSFQDDKLELMKQIIYDTNINGFYSFNKFFMRDALLTVNSSPVCEWLDFCIKTKEVDIDNQSFITTKLFELVETINWCILQIRNKDINKECSTIPLEMDYYENYFINAEIIKDYEQKSFDSKIERIMKNNRLALLQNWRKFKSKYFANWFEDHDGPSYKILIRDNKRIYDLGFINVYKNNNLTNFLFNWNTILSIIFNELPLEEIINIPHSLIRED